MTSSVGGISTANVAGAFVGAAPVIAQGVATGAAAGIAIAEAAVILGGAEVVGAVAASVLVGPIGWTILGTNGYTWDCWKPVVMDDSVGLSSGITLRELYYHSNLRRMTVNREGFVAENIRGERFRLSPVDIDDALGFYATLL